MEENIEGLVDTLTSLSTTTNTKLSDNLYSMITNLLQELDIQFLYKFISENFHSLCTLEHWAWKMLSENSNELLNQSKHIKLFHNLGTFNKNLIFNSDEIDSDKKASLLFPESIDLIDGIFAKMQDINDDNDPYFDLISLWLDNLSYFIHEHTQYIMSPIITDIDNSIARKFIMTDQYKFYFNQLQKPDILQSTFTRKQLFYLKTCSLSINAYCFCKNQKFPFTGDEILRYFEKDYLNMVYLNSFSVQSWTKELLSCITRIMSFICACCSWDDDKAKNIEILLPTEQVSHEYIGSLIRIISYKPFHEKLQIQRSNDETILLDVILTFLLASLHTHDTLAFIRFETNLLEILLPLAETVKNNRISSCVYGFLGEILCDEHLNEVKITNNLCDYFFYLLEQAWHHPKQKSQQILVSQLLRGFLSLAKNDAIQQKIAETNKVSLLIEMCDRYPIVYDILWALSFHHDIQQQLRSNQTLMLRLNHLKQELHYEPMGKITYGILWNLKSMYENRDSTDKGDETMFDIMISYSHKDKIFCKKLYDELIKTGYRVWIDFDQIHGNVMDAMAQAIEQSNAIIICMSEQYRRSNYCRAEASYAFQRRARIVPILLQEHYQPDGWLLFLVGQLIYVDYTKYEFLDAMEMLIRELKAPVLHDDNVLRVESREDASMMNSSLSITRRQSTFPVLAENILDWTQTDVRDWLIDHNLTQMSHLLSDYNGPSLINFYKYLTTAESHQILKLLQEDSLRRTNQSLSIVELARLQNLIDQQQKLFQMKKNTERSNKKSNKHIRNQLNFCKIT
ncbi:unnamed protein product [Rotaria magnacalcarata]|uniref:TIR domain-containing protein n=2 Tax=Rotaria magnacalcarata TaxID=392030 RepID=A0A815X9P0_9BILA|nr:unnamed protein product [Rotaria magnacalcarata]